MLAEGLLVVRHSNRFCNTFQLNMEASDPQGSDDDAEPDGHRLEHWQRPIPWAKAAYLQELRKPVFGFLGVLGAFWGASLC